jgi:hypothetical protein
MAPFLAIKRLGVDITQISACTCRRRRELIANNDRAIVEREDGA